MKTSIRAEHLPDQDLAYFPKGTEGFIDSVRAVSWARKYARADLVEIVHTLRQVVCVKG